MTEAGPNDARRVVWGIGMSILFFFRVFISILTHLFRYITSYFTTTHITRHDMGVDGTQKRRISILSRIMGFKTPESFKM